MSKKKSALSALSAILLACALAGCGSDEATSHQPQSASPAATPEVGKVDKEAGDRAAYALKLRGVWETDCHDYGGKEKARFSRFAFYDGLIAYETIVYENGRWYGSLHNCQEGKKLAHDGEATYTLKRISNAQTTFDIGAVSAAVPDAREIDIHDDVRPYFSVLKLIENKDAKRRKLYFGNHSWASARSGVQHSGYKADDRADDLNLHAPFWYKPGQAAEVYFPGSVVDNIRRHKEKMAAREKTLGEEKQAEIGKVKAALAKLEADKAAAATTSTQTQTNLQNRIDELQKHLSESAHTLQAKDIKAKEQDNRLAALEASKQELERQNAALKGEVNQLKLTIQEQKNRITGLETDHEKMSRALVDKYAGKRKASK